MKNFLGLYTHHAYFILSHRSAKCVTESNKSLNLESLFINWGTKFLVTAD